jgi:GDP-D-mannose 3',5'-epimerase
MKLVVTGGAGMIGSHLVEALIGLGHEVIVLDNFWRGSLGNLERSIQIAETGQLRIIDADLSSIGVWTKELVGADCVYHLADIVAGIGYVFSEQSFVFRKNLQINIAVSEAAEIAAVKRFVYVGTACSFPQSLQTGVDAPPLTEDQQIPADPESAYGWSKLMGELDAKYFTEATRIPSVILSFHNVYGPNCEFAGPRSQAIPALVSRMVDASESGDKQVDVWGDGQQGRDFIYVSDIVTGLISALNKGENAGVIQLGTGICTSIADVAKMLRDTIDSELSLNFDTSRPSGDRGRCADFSKATTCLDWRPRVTLSEGLQSTVHWIRQQKQ